MSFDIKTDNSLTKEEKYIALIPQLKSLIEDENNFIANLANITSALKYTFEDFVWVGFYLRENEGENELVLGPFQGRVACTRISLGKGVCGVSALNKETILVNDVDKFPGHIVCDSSSRSEIVIPVKKNGEIAAVLDIDSDKLNNFDLTDKKYLEEIINNIAHIF